MKRIKRVREKKGISQKEAAKDLGMSNVQLSRYESGVRSPDFETALKISSYYGESIGYLLGESNTEDETASLEKLEGFFGYDLDSLTEEEKEELKQQLKKEVEFYLWQKKQKDEG